MSAESQVINAVTEYEFFYRPTQGRSRDTVKSVKFVFPKSSHIKTSTFSGVATHGTSAFDGTPRGAANRDSNNEWVCASNLRSG